MNTKVEIVSELLKQIPVGKVFSMREFISYAKNILLARGIVCYDDTIITYTRKIRYRGERVFRCIDRNKSLYVKMIEAPKYKVSQRKFCEGGMNGKNA